MVLDGVLVQQHNTRKGSQENWVGQFMTNVGAVLRSPSEMLDAVNVAVMMTDATILQLECYVWRPPWLGFELSQAFSENMERDFGRIIERDKRKPPWRQVVDE